MEIMLWTMCAICILEGLTILISLKIISNQEKRLIAEIRNNEAITKLYYGSIEEEIEENDGREEN